MERAGGNISESLEALVLAWDEQKERLNEAGYDAHSLAVVSLQRFRRPRSLLRAEKGVLTGRNDLVVIQLGEHRHNDPVSIKTIELS